MNSQRNASIDVLRLICMIMVVSMHYFGWGGINNSTEASILNFVIAGGISVLSRVAVNGFFMISGYFLKSQENEITGKQVVTNAAKYYKKVYIYSVGVFLICCLMGLTTFSWKELLDAALPIMSNQYWFMTVFILFLCVNPFLRKFFVNMRDAEIIILLLTLAFFDCIQTNFGNNAFSEKGAGVLHAFSMFALGYGMQRLAILKLKKFPAIVLYVVNCVLAGGLSIVQKMIFKMNDAVAVYYNSPFIVAASIGFFAFFVDWKCKWIFPSRIAPYVLAVYLINDHPAIRANIYEKVLHCSYFYHSNFMVVHWLACVIGFVILGIGIDYLLMKAENGLRRIARK